MRDRKPREGGGRDIRWQEKTPHTKQEAHTPRGTHTEKDTQKEQRKHPSILICSRAEIVADSHNLPRKALDLIVRAASH